MESFLETRGKNKNILKKGKISEMSQTVTE